MRTGRPSAWSSATRCDDRRPLGFLAGEDPVGQVPALDRPVGRDAHHRQAVDRPHLVGDLTHRAAHPRQTAIAAKETLIGHAGDGDARAGDLAALLHLDHLVEALAPEAVGHQPPGIFVDDLHLAVAHEIVLARLEEADRSHRLTGQLLAHDDPLPHPAKRLGQPGDAFTSFARQHYPPLVGEDAVVSLGGERLCHFQGSGDGPLIERRFALRGNQERRARLVDQHAVRLVDDGEGEAAEAQARALRFPAEEARELHAEAPRGLAEDDAVAKIVEGKLLVGAVGDVAAIRLLAVGERHAALDDADGQAERGVDRPHQFGVALGEIVVDRDHVRRQPGERRRSGGQRGGQRLAFAGRHLGEHAFEKGEAAHDLDVEVALSELSGRAFSHESKRARNDVVREPMTTESTPRPVATSRLAAPPSPANARPCSSTRASSRSPWQDRRRAQRTAGPTARTPSRSSHPGCLSTRSA